MWLCSKQSSFFSFYALPSGGESKDVVVHWLTKALVSMLSYSDDLSSNPTEVINFYCVKCLERTEINYKEAHYKKLNRLLKVKLV